MKRVVFPKTSTLGGRLLSSAAAAKSYPPKEITIPPAVKRSSTDVLKALSSTVGVDPTAPHFAFIDDPAMIPSTTNSKRLYFFAKEMGKRAARQLAEEWPTLFAFDRDQPELPVFRPIKAADPLKVEPTEKNLLTMIESREVQDAVMLYERMRTENIDVSDPIQLELFKLVCYYNGKNVPFAENEEWHGLRNLGKDDYANWTQGGTADLLFETLPKTADTVSAMICGLCKFKSSKRASELYKEYLPKKFIARNAFDSLISVSPFNKGRSLLEEMKAEGIQPTLSTFNALLKSASTVGFQYCSVIFLFHMKENRYKLMEEVVGEMLALGITPSLTSFAHIIGPAVEEWPQEEQLKKGKESQEYVDAQLVLTWLVEIVGELEKRPEISLEGVADHEFFNGAMRLASRAENLDLADRILKLCESDRNQVKLHPFGGEDKFYKNYLALFIESSSSIEEIAEKYRSFVPRLVGVARDLTAKLCAKFKEKPHWPLLRRVIEDGIASRFMVDQKTTTVYRQGLINISYESLNAAERDEFNALVTRVVDIWVEFSNFTEEYNRRLQVKLHPIAISECALLLNRIGESERAYKMLEMLLDTESSQGENATVFASGYARPGPMAELFEDALRNRDVYKASICLEVMSQYTPKAKLEPLAMRIQSTCKLTESQARIIDGFVRLRPE